MAMSVYIFGRGFGGGRPAAWSLLVLPLLRRSFDFSCAPSQAEIWRRLDTEFVHFKALIDGEGSHQSIPRGYEDRAMSRGWPAIVERVMAVNIVEYQQPLGGFARSIRDVFAGLGAFASYTSSAAKAERGPCFPGVTEGVRLGAAAHQLQCG